MRITFTGVDRRTTKGQIEALLADDRVEIGVLMTGTPEGRNRYMEPEEILRALEWCRGRSALHVCGGRARDALLHGDLDAMVVLAGRVQVNGALPASMVEAICRVYPRHEIITQHTDRNRHLLDIGARNHSVLVDGSGGRGISPAGWNRPVTGKSVGFAGGLGLLNIASEIEKIRAVAADPFWIDMEGKVRNADDWFDVWACHDVLEATR